MTIATDHHLAQPLAQIARITPSPDRRPHIPSVGYRAAERHPLTTRSGLNGTPRQRADELLRKRRSERAPRRVKNGSRTLARHRRGAAARPAANARACTQSRRVTQPPRRQPHSARQVSERPVAEQDPQSVALTEVRRASGRPATSTLRRGDAPCSQATQRYRQPRRATTQAEVDVLVVEEVPLVEQADVAQELGAEQHRAAGEQLDVARAAELRPVGLAVADVDAGAVAAELDADAVDESSAVATRRRRAASAAPRRRDGRRARRPAAPASRARPRRRR